MKSDFFEGIASMVKRSPNNLSKFCGILKGKVSKTIDNNIPVQIYRDLMKYLHTEKELMECLIDTKILKVFTEKVLNNVKKSNIQTGRFSDIYIEDIEIIKYLKEKECKICLENIKNILKGISYFMGLGFQGVYGLNRSGIRDFWNNIIIPKLIFYSTLILYKGSVFEKYKVDSALLKLYAERLFQYYLTLKHSARNSKFYEAGLIGSIVSLILWVLLKENLSLQINTTKLKYDIKGVISELMKRMSKNEFREKLPEFLNELVQFREFYAFLDSLEKTYINHSEFFKKCVAEYSVKNLDDNNYKIFVDFPIFFSKFANGKYIERLKKITNKNSTWFKEIVTKNLKSDNKVLWKKTCNFLLIEPIVCAWDKDIIELIFRFIKNRLEDIEFLETLLESKGHYLTKLIGEFLKQSRMHFKLLFAPFGQEFIAYFIDWLKEEIPKINIEIFKLVFENSNRFFTKEDERRFFETLLEKINKELGSINPERFDKIWKAIPEKRLKYYVSQEFLRDLIEQLIKNNFKNENSIEIVLDFIQSVGYVEDSGTLKENIKNYLEKSYVNEETSKLLEKLIKLID